MSEKKTKTFEGSLERLEKIVKAMEEGRLTLEEMTTHFEEGTHLISFCEKKLNEVERKIEILVKKNGTTQEVPFDVPDE